MTRLKATEISQDSRQTVPPPAALLLRAVDPVVPPHDSERRLGLPRAAPFFVGNEHGKIRHAFQASYSRRVDAYAAGRRRR